MADLRLTDEQAARIAEIDNSTPAYVHGVFDLLVRDEWEPGDNVADDQTVRHIALGLAMRSQPKVLLMHPGSDDDGVIGDHYTIVSDGAEFLIGDHPVELHLVLDADDARRYIA